MKQCTRLQVGGRVTQLVTSPEMRRELPQIRGLTAVRVELLKLISDSDRVLQNAPTDDCVCRVTKLSKKKYVTEGERQKRMGIEK